MASRAVAKFLARPLQSRLLVQQVRRGSIQSSGGTFRHVNILSRTARCYSSVDGSDAVPAPSGSNNASPKIKAIVDDISKLTLIEVSELCTVLKMELNIPDAAPVGFAMPAGAAASDGASEDTAPEDTGPVMVDVTLAAFADDSKVKVIKIIKKIMSEVDPKFNLAQAKKFVESLPQKVKEGISKDDAEKLKEALEAEGGKVDIA